MPFSAQPVTYGQWVRSCVARYLRQNLKRLLLIALWTALVLLLGSAGLTLIRPEYLIAVLLLLPIYIALIFLLYWYSSQAFAEAWVLFSLAGLHRDISKRISSARHTPTKTALLSTLESVRQSIRELMNQSVAVLPMSDFLFEKTRQSIDVFFYTASTVVLSEKPSYYSSSDERRAQLEKDLWDEELELEAQAQEAQQSEEDSLTGHVRYFGLSELESFVQYLADRIFSKESRHSMLVIKYAINIVDFLNFFEHWNDLLLHSENGNAVAERAKAEVKEFHSEIRRRGEARIERIWNFVVTILSAFIGFALGYLTRFLP